MPFTKALKLGNKHTPIKEQSTQIEWNRIEDKGQMLPTDVLLFSRFVEIEDFYVKVIMTKNTGTTRTLHVACGLVFYSAACLYDEHGVLAEERGAR